MSAGGADAVLIGAGGIDAKVRDAPHERYGMRVEQALSIALSQLPAELASQVHRHVRLPSPVSFHSPACGAADRLAVIEMPGRHPVWLIQAWSADSLWFVRPRRRFLAGWDLSQACPSLAQALG
jgi:hypothetical protein